MKVLVGLSGGVDSAIAAFLLKEQGHDVTCAFMRNWDSLTNRDILGNPTLDEAICTQEQDYNDAKAVADKLGLELLRVDFISEYWDEVFETFLSEYKKGRTPNPDILCNRYIKFSHFLDFASKNGFKNVATGHYARTIEKDGTTYLAKANDLNKDQSYFLAEINRDVLPNIIFPLGKLTKPEVRKIALDLDLTIAKKKDSTGICFIGERNFREFLSNYLPMKKGKIIDIETNKVVGEHQGVLYYTIGQRKGLNIGGIGPFYVVGKNVETNELFVCDEEHIHWLYTDECIVSGVNHMCEYNTPKECHAKFRYRQADQDVCIEKVDDSTLRVKYPQGIKGVTPGQEAVIYDGDILLAGGVIENVYHHQVDRMEEINQRRYGK